MWYLILLLCSSVTSQEVTTPSSELKPRDYNHHAGAFDDAEPTKQGPVLFPNDGPPPPRPPLIVTSRPLLESIARSELADNMTEASQSQNIVASLRNNLASFRNNLDSTRNHLGSQTQDRVSFVPFLARVKDYRPYVPSPSFDYQVVPTRIPYADLVKKSRLIGLQQDNRYNDYEEQTSLPPVYKALSDHAAQKVLNSHPHKANHYQVKPLAYNRQYQDNDINEDNSEYDENKNYAFSYTVKDHKTGDDFSHSQHSSGSATNGEYRVRLPDGRMQIVSYTADENGYKADVRYDDDDEKAGNSIDNNQQYNNHNQQNYHNQQNNYHNQQDNYHNQQDNYHNQLDNFNSPQPNYQTPKYSYVTVRPQNYITPNHFVTPIVNNYVNNQQNDYGKQIDYADRSNNKDYGKQTDYADRSNKNDYDIIEKKELKTTDKDYYQYPDVSKEYYTDYSSEYNNNYQPHRSKFNFVNNKNVEITNKATASTVKPSYEELKDLFVNKNIYNTKQNYDNIVSSTPNALEENTERVVNIGGKNPKLYTNIKNSLSLYGPTSVPVYATPKVIVATTPKSYLVSTIASLKNKISLASKPVLSDDYISRINKYINFNK